MALCAMRDLTPQFPVPVYLINLDRSPDRLAHAAAELDRCGVIYNPLLDEWRLSRDTDVNFMMVFARAA